MNIHLWNKPAFMASILLLGGTAGFAARPCPDGVATDALEERKAPRVSAEPSDDEDEELVRLHLEVIPPSERFLAEDPVAPLEESKLEPSHADPLDSTEFERALAEARGETLRVRAALIRDQQARRLQEELARRHQAHLAERLLALETPGQRTARQAAMAAERAARGLPPVPRTLFP